MNTQDLDKITDLFPHHPNSYIRYDIETMREVKEIFNDGYDPRLNWLFVSMQGIHGSYLSLDEVEEIIRGESEFTESVNGRYYVTILIIHPRLATIKWGEILVGLNDVDFLRKIVRNTLEAINESQERNI